MAYVGVDPWRWQYFADVPCPPGVTIPIDDPWAWELYPRWRWIYDKLAVAESQGLACAPHGIAPRRYPVFSKPVVNLKGMGAGGFVLRGPRDYARRETPGHFWMPLLTGAHVSSDFAVLDGRPRWSRHTLGIPRRAGTFDRWEILAAKPKRLERYLGAWVRRHMAGFSGVMNFESIGGRIIEVHLRMAEQWLDLNGAGWLAAVNRLYAEGEWRFRDRPRPGYSVVLWGDHRPRHRRIDPVAVEALRRLPGVSSIQITFDPVTPPWAHAMPPGGFRLAIVNGSDLAACRAARRRLAALFDRS
ncbi:MAG: hypothetical protein FJX46_10635 [Alphaproteobacteria bacterium]|nr:hypothetical protein [Alphaproteobacteria bacterium]